MPVDELEDIHGSEDVHPLLKLWAEERDRVVKTAKVAVSAGVKQRSAQLANGEAELIADLIRTTFDDPRLGLSTVQRDEGVRAVARRMRALDSDPEQVAVARDIIARHDRAVRGYPDRTRNGGPVPLKRRSPFGKTVKLTRGYVYLGTTTPKPAKWLVNPPKPFSGNRG